MHRPFLLSLTLAGCLSLSAPAVSWAQSAGEGGEQAAGDPRQIEPPAEEQPRDTSPEDAPSGGEADAQPAVAKSAPEHNFPDDPAQRVERAERAFENSDFDLLDPLLEPLLVPESVFDEPSLEIRARTLYGIGLYFDAQQVTDAQARQKLLEGAEAQFLEILRTDPDHSLNPLIDPASVVELFESVKEEHAAELDKIRAARAPSNTAGGQQGLQTVYIEREVGFFAYGVNFVPFGMGQFQNGETFKGAFFASTQAAALGLNVASYWMIESLRSPNGYFEPGSGNAADQAFQWRTAQYVGIGLFAGLYLWSVIDALLDYQPTRVRIRTLDEPPPELGGGETDDNGASFQIGWGGVGVTW